MARGVHEPASEGYAGVNGTRLHYVLAGEGEPIVLIHGWSFDLRCWDDLVPALAQEYRLLRYDLRGFGRSSLPVPGQAYAHTDDLIALLDHLGIGQVHVLGHSFGGGIALDLALRYPERTLSLILPDAAVHLVDPPRGEATDAWIGGTWQAGQAQGVEAAKQIWLAGPPLAPALRNPRAAALVRRMVADYTGWHWHNPDPRVRIEPYPSERLGDIAVPTLVLVGGENVPVYHEVARIQHTCISGSRLVTMPGVGHALNIEDPQAFNAVVLGFLREITEEREDRMSGMRESS